jgi:hypothetical protein
MMHTTWGMGHKMFTKVGIFKYYFVAKIDTTCAQKSKRCGENNRFCIFSKISAIFVNFRKEIFAQTKINFLF